MDLYAEESPVYEGVERRREVRAFLHAPVRVQYTGADGVRCITDEVSEDISLSGIAFATSAMGVYEVHGRVVVSVAIPAGDRGTFPFTRLAGVGRVVRVQPLAQVGAAPPRAGVALEFGNDVTALAALPLQ